MGEETIFIFHSLLRFLSHFEAIRRKTFSPNDDFSVDFLFAIIIVASKDGVSRNGEMFAPARCLRHFSYLHFSARRDARRREWVAKFSIL